LSLHSLVQEGVDEQEEEVQEDDEQEEEQEEEVQEDDEQVEEQQEEAQKEEAQKEKVQKKNEEQVDAGHVTVIEDSQEDIATVQSLSAQQGHMYETLVQIKSLIANQAVWVLSST